jgi:N-acetylglucosamine-6-phosphate deacetylase
MVARTGVTVAKASSMASANPAAFLGLSGERGTLAPGLRADWVRLTHDLWPSGTWIGGRQVSDGPSSREGL